jgi:hypothetical protein
VTDSIGGADDAQEATRASEAQSKAQAWRLGSDSVEQPGTLRTITAVGLVVGPDPAVGRFATVDEAQVATDEVWAAR